MISKNPPCTPQPPQYSVLTISQAINSRVFPTENESSRNWWKSQGTVLLHIGPTLLTMWWRRDFLLAVSFTVASFVMYSRLNPPAPVLNRKQFVSWRFCVPRSAEEAGWQLLLPALRDHPYHVTAVTWLPTLRPLVLSASPPHRGGRRRICRHPRRRKLLLPSRRYVPVCPSCVGGHILQEFNTLFLTRFRTYKIATPDKNLGG